MSDEQNYQVETSESEDGTSAWSRLRPRILFAGLALASCLACSAATTCWALEPDPNSMR